jgi:hypothetical protein
MEGHGFNIKAYKRFLEYINEEISGEINLFTKKWRLGKMSPGFIESRIEELGLDMVIVDPIYKLRSPRRRSVRHEELQDTVDAVQDMCETYNIPIIITNQAHRLQGNARGDAPHKDSSFGSDAPAQESDHVIGVKHFEEERKLVLRCTKNRFGGNFRADVVFWPNVGKVQDVTELRTDYFNGREGSDEEVAKFIKEGADSGDD